MMPPQVEVGLTKLLLCLNRSWIDDCPMPRFLFAQMAGNAKISLLCDFGERIQPILHYIITESAFGEIAYPCGLIRGQSRANKTFIYGHFSMEDYPIKWCYINQR